MGPRPLHYEYELIPISCIVHTLIVGIMQIHIACSKGAVDSKGPTSLPDRLIMRLDRQINVIEQYMKG